MKRAATVFVPLASLVLIGIVAASHARDLGQTLDQIAAWVFGLAVVAHLLVLVVRAEAWRLTLAATGTAPSRATAHRASAIGFLVGILEGHAALPARIAAARHIAPASTPSLTEMALSDIPIYALEACVLAVLVPIAVVHDTHLPPWTAALALLGAPAGVLALRLLHQRYEARRLAAGLAVLARPGLRGRLLGLCAVIVGLTFARVWLILWAVGLPATPADAAVAYVAVTLIGQLPLGPATGPAATLAVASASGTAPATAAGLVISATSIAAVLGYVGCASPRGVRSAL